MTSVADEKKSRLPAGCPPDEPLAPGEVACSRYFRWKGVLGQILAFVLLIPGLPAMGFLILLVRCTSRGPGIYRQLRVGKDGRQFMMYKIRTMRHDAEKVHGPQWTAANDSRITTLGRVLRKLHLDELPQLFNVLAGEMHLIGPRPERPEFTQVLARAIPGYLDRLAVRPGITGLAQINLPPDTDLESVRRKLTLDMEYIHHASFLLDVRMFVSTLLRMLGLRGEYAMTMMGLRREVPPIMPQSEEERTLNRCTPQVLLSSSGPHIHVNGKSNGHHNGASGEHRSAGMPVSQQR